MIGLLFGDIGPRTMLLATQTLAMSASLLPRRPAFFGAGIALVAVLAAAEPAWSGGSNPAGPPPPLPTLTPVTPSTNQTSLVSSATCAQQLSDAINDANAAGLALNATAAGLMAATGLPPAVIAGAVALAGGTASQIAAQVYTTAQTSVANSTHPTVGLPNCDATFAGTVGVTTGGINVTGNSVFNNSLGVAGNLVVQTGLSANTLSTSGGISTFGGAITIGDPNLTTYSSGITLGGGALSGAGTGGLQAFTGDVTAIAIGNNAQATQVGSLALGLNSSATGVSSTAVGNASQALADQTVAIGFGALVSAAAGAGSFAGGTSTVLSGTGAVSIGNLNMASGDGAVAIGDPNTAAGTGAVAVGANNTATGRGAVAIGNQNTAAADGSIALGQSATASATNSVAIGTGATSLFANSTAIGAGATTSTNNQIVLGTASESVTAPGIDSALSRSRQVGPLGVVTSDSTGNLASDGGALYQELATVKAGAAVAMALSDPYLTASERFGVKLNYGTYDGANAIGMSASGLLYRGLFNMKNQLVASGAVGYGSATVQGYTQNVFGGHAGLQLSW